MKPAYTLIWQAPTMAAPAFWYFATREAAEQTSRAFQVGTVTTIEETQVADDFELDE